MKLPILTEAQAIENLQVHQYPAQINYLAMYSSWFGGIVKNPHTMLVPIDDHLVHRGDGVFEALKVVDGALYLLDQHLERLMRSSSQIAITTRYSKDQIRDILLQTWQAAGGGEAILRLFLSRGPGAFSANPYDSVGEQLYVVATSLQKVSEQKYNQGVKIGRSQIEPKDPWFARIKSCNYLPNVLMKKEAVDRGLDFTIGISREGFLTEGSTENLVLITQDNKLVSPHFETILRGTTMTRTFELAQNLVQQKILSGVGEAQLTEKELIDAREVMMVGTTLDILPVVEYENKKIGDGEVGPVSKKLLQLLREDMKSGPYRTN